MAKGKCAQRAKHRAAQARHVAKNPKKQAAKVKASTKRTGGAKSGSSAKGAGKHGHKIGRPRKPC